MLTLLGSLLGLLGAVLPDLMGLLRNWQDRRFELQMVQLQLQALAAQHTYRMEEINAQADIAEMRAVHRPEPNIGIGWVDALRGSVRPVITYAFFTAYVAVKVAQYQMLSTAGMDAALPWLQGAAAWQSILVQLWTPEDQALFAGIMAFWFGGRAMQKVRERA